jgi:hypothetical protein
MINWERGRDRERSLKLIEEVASTMSFDYKYQKGKYGLFHICSTLL